MIKDNLWKVKLEDSCTVGAGDPSVGDTVLFTNLMRGEWYIDISTIDAGEGRGEKECSLSLIHDSLMDKFIAENIHHERSSLWQHTGHEAHIESGKAFFRIYRDKKIRRRYTRIPGIAHAMLFSGEVQNLYPNEMSPDLIVCGSGFGNGIYDIYGTHEDGDITGLRIEFIDLNICNSCTELAGLCKCGV